MTGFIRRLLNGRYSLLYFFVLLFLCISSCVRLTLLILSLKQVTFSVTSILIIFGKGFIYDVGVATFFCVLYSVYLLIIPARWNKSAFNKGITYTGFFLAILITMFSFFAEFTFWGEFECRFNFIAVDYLVYTYEVINNINESYPLPLLIGGMLLVSLLIFWMSYKKGVFKKTFNSKDSFPSRLLHTGATLFIAIFYILFVKNSWAENSTERYRNELSKAGIYSFFAAFKGNELNYENFYKHADKKSAFQLLRNSLADSNSVFSNDPYSISRDIINSEKKQSPNIIMLTIESFSADFLTYFGNPEHITPVLDSLANNSIFFSNLYATGNRTVRGMEALTLCIPPTPGSSIVRREHNDNLATVGSIFRKAGYETGFFYGGDGYFDNMNKYFGNNGYNVTDRGKRILPGDNFESHRTHIKDEDVHFENAWGICDEDLYDAVIRDADVKFSSNERFYDFVMTTSNHRPYTYPAGKIDLPSGSGRAGAVRYTDYAIGAFLNKIKAKPWFKNTIIILVADHCANSAGKNEIDISKYHIPCWIVNLNGVQEQVINKMCSQIDIYPTLFNILGWNYHSNLFGLNVLSPNYEERIFCGTYQKLGYMKKDSLVILGPQKTVQTFIYNKKTNSQIPMKLNLPVQEAIAQYQSAYYLFKQGKLKQ